MHIPDHLQKSRHDIWHYRRVMPAAVRSRHPGLPRELKRSTHTADMREARVAARRLHQAGNKSAVRSGGVGVIATLATAGVSLLSS